MQGHEQGIQGASRGRKRQGNGSLQKECSRRTDPFQTSDLQKYKVINPCCFNYPYICGNLLWQPEEANTSWFSFLLVM